MARPVVRYTRTADGLEIAYQVLGEGPIDVVIVPGLSSNVDRNADYPLYGGYLRRQGQAAASKPRGLMSPRCRKRRTR